MSRLNRPPSGPSRRDWIALLVVIVLAGVGYGGYRLWRINTDLIAAANSLQRQVNDLESQVAALQFSDRSLTDSIRITYGNTRDTLADILECLDDIARGFGQPGLLPSSCRLIRLPP